MVMRVGGIAVYDVMAASPPAQTGRALTYVKSDGHLYVRGGDGTERRVSGYDVVDSGWITPELFNGWVPESGTTGYGVAGYRKIDGVVYCRGLVENGTDGAIFNLPSGFRPSASHTCPAIMNSHMNTTVLSSAGVGHAHISYRTQVGGRLDLYSNGNVSYNSFGVFGNGYVSLCNVMFPADA